MSEDFVIDANVLVALFDTGDKWNSRANEIMSNLGGLDEFSSENVNILDLVVSEVVNVLIRRLKERGESDEKVKEVISEFINSVKGKITWVAGLVEFWFDEILDVVLKSSGKLNFNDAFIVVFCKHRGIKKLISFDRDFDEIDFIERIF